MFWLITQVFTCLFAPPEIGLTRIGWLISVLQTTPGLTSLSMQELLLLIKNSCSGWTSILNFIMRNWAHPDWHQSWGVESVSACLMKLKCLESDNLQRLDLPMIAFWGCNLNAICNLWRMQSIFVETLPAMEASVREYRGSSSKWWRL